MKNLRIERLEINNLFGRFFYKIDLGGDKGWIKILTAPNGYGKSTILKVINSFASGEYDYFVSEKFDSIKFDLSDGAVVKIFRSGDDVLIESGENKISIDKIIKDRRKRFMFKRPLPFLRKVDSEFWRDERTGEIFDTREMFVRYDELRSFHSLYGPSKHRSWLEDIGKSLSVFSISTNRLKSDINRTPRRFEGELSSSLAVDVIAEVVRNKIQKEIRRQFEEGRQLEASFPGRLIAALTDCSENPSENLIVETINLVQQYEARFAKLGLVPETGSAAQIKSVKVGSLKEAGFVVLKTYLDDILKKFNRLDELARRLEVFCNSINELLAFKSVSTSADDGIVVKISDKEGEDVPLNLLSSGEQHLIVLIGELVFNAREDSLVLIDEPEISFHPEWQEKFLGILENIQKENAFSVLLSTHSPMLIGDRWDSVIELALQYESAEE